MLTKLIRVEPREVLLVKGPATLHVNRNPVTVLGAPLVEGRSLIVRRGRLLPVEGEGPFEAVIRVEEPGGYSLHSGGLGTRSWQPLAHNLVERARKEATAAIILGKADSGKSTVTAFLANTALAQGVRVAVVDCDVGQTDLAPPGCLGAAKPSEFFYDLRDVPAARYEFVGFTSPSYYPDFVIERARRLLVATKAWAAHLILINSDGYVDGDGLNYKLNLVRSIDPDTLVVMGDSFAKALPSELLGDREVLVAPVPEGVVKNPRERYERRLAQYMKFVGRGRVKRLYPRQLSLNFLEEFYRIVLVKDRRLEARDGGWLWLGRSHLAGIHIHLKSKKVVAGFDSPSEIFVGLGHRSEVEGFGLFSIGHDSLRVETPFTGNFDTIHLAAIRVQQEPADEKVFPLYLYTS